MFQRVGPAGLVAVGAHGAAEAPLADSVPCVPSLDSQGYFSSRPSFKAFVRESSSYMQSARQLQAFVGGVTDLGPSNLLFKLERAMGVCQHHDSISGTAKQNVNDGAYKRSMRVRTRAGKGGMRQEGAP